MRENLSFEEILGVHITAEDKSKILEFILKGLKNNNKKFFIVTPNPEIIMYAQAHTHFKTILNQADVALPDGVGVVLAAKLLGKSIKTRITGADFMEELCNLFSKQQKIVGFLGGRGNVAKMTAECLMRKYPGLRVAFASSELPRNRFVLTEESGIMNQELWKEEKNKTHGSLFVLYNSIDMLFVAFGFPKQEEWIHENLDRLPVKAAMGVGGAFDYISGRVLRAPKLMRALGLEWLFRLMLQPWRISRQIALVTFTWLVFKKWWVATFSS